jgi:hypothetical protein
VARREKTGEVMPAWDNMITWYTVDKSEWEQGPWMDEPDKAQWIDKDTGLDCLIVRGPMGALCGYVGVPETHRYFGKEYATALLNCHGGPTFSDRCNPDEDPATGICHTGPVANPTVWWFGFDCAHAMDLMPGLPDQILNNFFADRVYRDFAFVKKEVQSLANQLSEVKP